MLIKRNQYLKSIRRFYESNLIKVLTGVRRCGKSVLLNQIKEELINEKKIREVFCTPNIEPAATLSYQRVTLVGRA